MSLKNKIEEELTKGYNWCYSPFKPQNTSEVAGMINTGIKPNILSIIDEAKKEFLNVIVIDPKENDYETSIPQSLEQYKQDESIWNIFKKWFGES